MMEPKLLKLIIRYFFIRQDARLRSLYVTEDKEVIPTYLLASECIWNKIRSSPHHSEIFALFLKHEGNNCTANTINGRYLTYDTV